VETVIPTATIVVADTALKVGETSLVTITFSEAVSGFTDADLTVANGTLGILGSGDGGVTWTATFTPTTSVTDTSNLITLDNSGVTNTSGNAGVGTTDSNNYAIDTARPTATIVVANPVLPIGETTQVTITFSEAVSGFDNSDMTVANGTLSAVSSGDGGVTWTATFTPTGDIADTSNLITFNNSGVSDSAGNSGTGATDSNNFIIDTQRPTATVVVANSALSVGQTTTVTITFSEAVSGFTNSDLSVANGTLSALSSSDGGKTWTATLTPTANIANTTNLITLNNSGVSDAFGNTGSGTTDSNNYAISTVPVAGDPEFRVDPPVVSVDPPNVPLQPIVFAPPTGNLGSPLAFTPLFESPTSGGGLPPVGNIFVNNGALAPSFIAQVFTSSESGGNGAAQGSLGFGGGDGGVFGSSSLSSLFSQDSVSQSNSFNTFGSTSITSGDASQGLRGAFGAPTLGQQLQQIKDTEQRQILDLAAALQQVGINEIQA
jgi:hypothetical protein